MRSLGTRRAVQVAGAATVAVVALAGCSAGQTAETSLLQTPVSGLNTASPDGGLLIRNLQVAYGDSAGYPVNSTAPLEVSLFNQTQQPLTVTISSQPQTTVTAGIVSAGSVGISGGATGSASPTPSGSASPTPSGSASPTPSGSASPTPSGSASAPSGAPATPALQPAKIVIDPLGTVAFLPGDPQSLQAVGLTDRLFPGNSLALTIQVGTAAPMSVLAPVATPLSPASRGPAVENENIEGE
jgi:hypothetical protein